MTPLMKFEIIIYYILKIFGYFCGFVGALWVPGLLVSHRYGNITDMQLWKYEIHAFILIGVCCIVYYIRKFIKEDIIRRNRLMKMKARLSKFAK